MSALKLSCFILGLSITTGLSAQSSDSSPRNWLSPTSLTEGTPLPKDLCTAADKLSNSEAQYRAAWFTSCGHLSPSANKFLNMRISQETLEWENIPAGSYNYPVFLQGQQVWKPNTGSCSVPLQVKWVHVCNTLVPTQPVRGGNEIIYDGEVKPFTSGLAWDASNSTIVESILAPASGRNHLRVILNNENYWGGAAYVFKDFARRDLAIYRKLTFKAKTPSKKALTLKVFFVSMDAHLSSERAEVLIGNFYEKYEIDLAQLRNGSFDFSDTQAIVFAISEPEDKQFLIDLDDLRIFL
jgi:hypothetical protein